jgi:hypothetical protein
MPAYLISYDLRKVRKYDALLKQLRDWSCHKLHESTWLGVLKGPAPTIRTLLRRHIDGDDRLAVLELRPGADWALTAVDQQDRRSGAWLSANVTPNQASKPKS